MRFTIFVEFEPMKCQNFQILANFDQKMAKNAKMRFTQKHTRIFSEPTKSARNMKFGR